MGTINSLQYLVWFKSKTVKIYLVFQNVKLLLALSIYATCNVCCCCWFSGDRFLLLFLCLFSCSHLGGV